jgi:sugar lactone lactonase YvrE
VSTPGVTIAESEPNDSVSTADSAALGVRGTGVVNPAGDVDTWRVHLTAGQIFSADVEAASIGSPLDATLALIAPDGSTVLAFNDDFDGFDSRISRLITSTGFHYVAIRGFGNLAGPEFSYAIDFGTVTCVSVGTEREPNDTPPTATPIAVGDSGSGEVCAADANPASDIDHWVFTAQEGTAVELDVDLDPALFADPILELFGADGITRLAFNDNQDGLESRLQFSITATGTYYAAVSAHASAGGSPFPYTLHVRTTAQGPGDPIAVVAEGLGTPLGLAIGSTGDLFVGDISGSRILRVSTGGAVTKFADVELPVGLAFDGTGDLLVVSLNGVVYRITPLGVITPFIADGALPLWIAVAPDGRIWLTEGAAQTLRRYSPSGHLEAEFDGSALGDLGPGPVVIGPGGEPHVSSGTDVWKLAGGRFQRVLTHSDAILSLGFDVKGNMYAPLPAAGRIDLFDPVGRLVHGPFAVGPDAPQTVAFARDGTGATLARVFATDTRLGRVIELNPAGVVAPGLPLGFQAPFTVELAAASLLGAPGLGMADLELLDAFGNHNGRYDIGDFHAYIRAAGGLPDATSSSRLPGSRP